MYIQQCNLNKTWPITLTCSFD